MKNLIVSSNTVRGIKSKRLGWADHLAIMEEGRRAFKILTGKPTGKRALGRPRCLRIGIIVKPLLMRHRTSEFHKPWSLLVS